MPNIEPLYIAIFIAIVIGVVWYFQHKKDKHAQEVGDNLLKKAAGDKRNAGALCRDRRPMEVTVFSRRELLQVRERPGWQYQYGEWLRQELLPRFPLSRSKKPFRCRFSSRLNPLRNRLCPRMPCARRPFSAASRKWIQR
mgnify:CR=1 FL=1